jgi:hypothetical protein
MPWCIDLGFPSVGLKPRGSYLVSRPFLRGLLTAALFGSATHVLAASEFALAGGAYTIRSNMMMPHLDEMRRITTEQTGCLQQDAPLGLFPVMRQPALHGCTLGFGEAQGTTFQYVLVCATARVATGTAELRRTGETIVGNLIVKMGGKNMTFAQGIKAARTGDCTPAP